MGGATEDEQPVYVFQSAQLDLSQRAGLFQPSKSLFYQPSAAQADGVAGVPGGAAVEVTAPSLVVLGYMRSHVQLPCHVHEILGVVGLVRAHGDTARVALLLLLEHQQGRVAFRESVGMGDHGGGDQAIAVLDKRVAQITQLRLLAVTLLVEPRIGIGGRCMRLVRALLAVKVRAVAIVATALGTKALLRGPGLNQRAVHGEVLVGHELLRAQVDLGEEPLRHLAGQQPVAVLREHRVLPYRIAMPRPTNQRNSRL